jgi:hypothetical protein
MMSKMRMNGPRKRDASSRRLQTLVALALSLAGMHSSGAQNDLSACDVSKRGAMSVDTSLARVLASIRKNAEAASTFARQYPFLLRFAVSHTSHNADGMTLPRDYEDTVRLYQDGVAWLYRPGKLLPSPGDTTGAGYGLGVYMRFWDARAQPHGQEVRIPTLLHFADANFLDNHCFSVHAEDTSTVRVDFIADRRIRGPDVNGSLFVDARRGLVTKLVMRVTQIPANTDCAAKAVECRTNVDRIEVTTTFDEAFAGVPVESGRVAVQRFKAASDSGQTGEYREESRRLNMSFYGRRPGEPP